MLIANPIIARIISARQLAVVTASGMAWSQMLIVVGEAALVAALTRIVMLILTAWQAFSVTHQLRNAAFLVVMMVIRMGMKLMLIAAEAALSNANQPRAASPTLIASKAGAA
jgi:hypothetical protein